MFEKGVPYNVCTRQLCTSLVKSAPLQKIAVILADDISKRILLNEKFRILIEISLKFVSKGQIYKKKQHWFR